MQGLQGDAKLKTGHSLANKIKGEVTIIANKKLDKDDSDKALMNKAAPTRSQEQRDAEAQNTAPKESMRGDFSSDYLKWLKKLKRPRPNARYKENVNQEQPIISETLARLLEKQGKKHEAIRMINQLILLNPEKKTYFAQLIEEFK